MSDFDDKLDAADDRAKKIQEEARQTEEAARQEQLARARAKEEAIIASHGVAMRRLKGEIVDDVMKKIQSRIDWSGAESFDRKREDGFVSRQLTRGESDVFEIKVFYDEQGVQLVVRVELGHRELYGARSDPFPVTAFDEAACDSWIEKHAVEAYDALRPHT